jgi:hypothetical protein
VPTWVPPTVLGAHIFCDCPQLTALETAVDKAAVACAATVEPSPLIAAHHNTHLRPAVHGALPFQTRKPSAAWNGAHGPSSMPTASPGRPSALPPTAFHLAVASTHTHRALFQAPHVNASARMLLVYDGVRSMYRKARRLLPAPASRLPVGDPLPIRLVSAGTDAFNSFLARCC